MERAALPRLAAASPEEKAATDPGGGRLDELDALRGLACVVVAASHFWFALGEGCLVPMISPPFRLPMFAVYVFFVISGHVVAHRYLVVGDVELLLAACFRRIPRLLIPALSSCLLLCTFNNLGFFAGEAAARRLSHSDWCDWCMTKSYKESFLAGVRFVHSYDFWYYPWLWSLTYELLGSVFVFWLAPIVRLAAGFDPSRQTQQCLVAHGAVLLILAALSRWEETWPELFKDLFFGLYRHGEADGQTWRILIAFEAGLCICHLRVLVLSASSSVPDSEARAAAGANRLAEAEDEEAVPLVSRVGATRASRTSGGRHLLTRPWLSPRWLLVASTILLSLFLSSASYLKPWPLYRYVSKSSEVQMLWERMDSDIIVLAAAATTAAVSLGPVELRRSLGKNLKWLGQMSFGIYLLHPLVLWSVGMPLYAVVRPGLGAQATLGICFATCLPFVLGISHLFWLYVEVPLAIKLPRCCWARLVLTRPMKRMTESWEQPSWHWLTR